MSHGINVALLPCEQGPILSELLTDSGGELGNAAFGTGGLKTALCITLEKAGRPLRQGLEANRLQV